MERGEKLGITMKELAKLAKVSQTAVSFVLTGRNGAHIAQSTRERILHLAREHNYTPNLVAKGLRENKRFAIGVIMPAPDNDLFCSEALTHLEVMLAAHGYTAIFAFWPRVPNYDVEAPFRTVMRYGVDGIIAWEYHDCMKDSPVPISIYDYYDRGIEFDRTVLNFQKDAETVVSHFEKLGHKKIGFVGPSDCRHLAALRQKVPEHGLSMRKEWIIANPIPDNSFSEKQLHRLIESPDHPSAFFTPAENTALFIITKLQGWGIRVPEDVSICSRNKTKFFHMLLPLTTFDTHSEQLTENLVRMVLERIDGYSGPPRSFELYSEFISDKTTAKYQKGR